MKYQTTVHPRGFTLIELLVTIAIIAVLISELLPPAVKRLQDSASAALQVPDLQPVAADVLQLTCGQESPPVVVLENAVSVSCGEESPLGNALADTQALVSMVQETQQLPDPQFLAEVSQELQAVGTLLRQDLAALDNPASVAMAEGHKEWIELYLELKHDLQDVVDDVQKTETKVKVIELKDFSFSP